MLGSKHRDMNKKGEAQKYFFEKHVEVNVLDVSS